MKKITNFKKSEFFTYNFYFQYLSTFIFTLLLIIKHSKYQLLQDFNSSNVLIGDFSLLPKSFSSKDFFKKLLFKSDF